MKICLIPGRALDNQLARTWARLQQSNPELASPYFCSEFTSAIASVRSDVEVAVLEESNKIVGFFPFQRGAFGVAKPVGGILSDYHGIICKLGFTCNVMELLRACSLRAWDFDHLLVSQTFFSQFHRFLDISPRIDLSIGSAAFCNTSHIAREVEKQARRIERDIGPLRLVLNDNETESLNQVLAWKSRQYIASGMRDFFSIEWFRMAVKQVLETSSNTFAGVFSRLYAGENLIAGHIGMRSTCIWHYWFPAYDKAYAKYSPGLILLLKMIEEASSLGLRAIDLGKGMSSYKQRLMNSSVSIAVGTAEVSWWLSSARTLKRSARRLIRPLVPRFKSR